MLNEYLESSKRKSFVIDTSVFIEHAESVHSFDGQDVYIPLEVLEELDNLKIRADRVGVASRYVNRFLDGVRKEGNLFKGVELDNGQRIFISSNSDLKLMPSGATNNNDNRIISIAVFLKQTKKDVILISKDIAMRVKCDSLGIDAEDYFVDGLEKSSDSYGGVSTLNISQSELDDFYRDGRLSLEDQSFIINEGVVLKTPQNGSALAIASSSNEVRRLQFATGRNFNIEGISPRSKEQVFAAELLLNPDIHMVTLTGMAGCGKTLLAIAAAMSQLHEGKYSKVILSRPVESTSKDIGFLPGNKEEKMAPWLRPIFDNLEFIYSKRGESYIKAMMAKGIVEVEALTYIRGRTLPDTIFIIDEAQNISHLEAKALLTRMGEGSKIILTGDLFQIDSNKVNEVTSGLNTVIDLFKDFDGAGHIKLIRGERSELATFAAKVM